MCNDIIFVIYYAYYNRKFIIQGSVVQWFRVQGSGFGGSHGGGSPFDSI